MAKKRISNGYWVWVGFSLLVPNQIIILVITGVLLPSQNTKTGPVIQSYIILIEYKPLEATMNKMDAPICGNCPLKNTICYVQLDKGTYQVWKSLHNGIYRELDDDGLQFIWDQELIFRLGSYGDPAAVHISEWDRILAHVKHWLGYTHQWHKPEFQELKRYCMASVETVGQAMQARQLGWRYYRIASEEDDMLLPNEMICPNQENRYITCSVCKLCNGLGYPKAKDIVIKVHGLTFKKRNFEKLKQRLIMESGEKIWVRLDLPLQEGLRPERIRVIDNPDSNGGYLVQSYNEARKLWISQKHWGILESAILDALLWYSLPQDTYKEGFNLNRRSIKGNINLIAYQLDINNPREWKHSIRVDSSSFAMFQQMIAGLPNSRLDSSNPVSISIVISKENKPDLYLRADFVPDFQYTQQPSLDPESMSEELFQKLDEMKDYFGDMN